ncbi:MAG: hypothetical protein ACI4US_06540 [Muribaculaceae bacterium]
MKKLFFIGVMMFAAMTAGAQTAVPGSMHRVGTAGGRAVISPDGSFVISQSAQGLQKTDLTTGENTVVAKGANLYDIAISADGRHVVYTRPSFNDKHLRFNSLESVDLGTGKTTVLVKPTRKLNAGVALSGNTVNAVAGGKARVKSLDGTKAAKAPVASISYGHLQVTGTDGKTVTIDPQGRASYLWPSVSPDGTRVLYRLSGVGTFTCNLDGSNVRPVGNYMFPVWAGNDAVIGVREVEGDSQQLVASTLVAVNLADGNASNITPADMIATSPSCTADGATVAFTTGDGGIYTVSLAR